jgi:two-component system, OmpR family, sensor histidine kinase KdpD
MRVIIHWLTMLAATIAITAAAAAARSGPTTVAFLYLVAVVFLSMWGGLKVGIAASLLATGCYNYFFLPPLHTFHIDDFRNWTALGAFLLAALVVTRIIVSARTQAAEAERRRLEGEASSHIELLQQSDAFKTSLLRAVSHDLTTPLTAIRIHTAALARHAASSPELAATAGAIAGETERLHRRIDNLLTIARLESGRFTPHPEPAPPADLFRNVQESLPGVFASRPVTISVAPDCPDAYVDPSLALEILVNLVENAHRASPPEGPLELAAFGSVTTVLLEVRDRGRGVALDSDVVQRGLGLEIARGLTTASGGAFTLENREGGGAVARVELPAAVLDAVEVGD